MLLGIRHISALAGVICLALFVQTSNVWAVSEGVLDCTLTSELGASRNPIPKVLFPFKGKAPVSGRSAKLAIYPKDMRYFEEKSFTRPEEIQEFQALAAVPASVKYKVELTNLQFFKATIWVSGAAGWKMYEAPAVPYVREEGFYPTARFLFKLSELPSPDPRPDQELTEALLLECFHQVDR